MDKPNWQTAKEYKDITYKKSNGVARIAFNRPDVRNAFRPNTTKELYDAFLAYTKRSSLRIYLCDERQHVDVQKSEIFEGVDILISTPKTMNRLFLFNGVNTTQLKIFSIDDAEFLAQKTSYTDIMAVTQSISKCQFITYSEKIHPTLKRFENYFMKHARIVAVKR